MGVPGLGLGSRQGFVRGAHSPQGWGGVGFTSLGPDRQVDPEKKEDKEVEDGPRAPVGRFPQELSQRSPREEQGVSGQSSCRTDEALSRGESTQPCWWQSWDWTTGSCILSQSCFSPPPRWALCTPPRKGREAGADSPELRRRHRGEG